MDWNSGIATINENQLTGADRPARTVWRGNFLLWFWQKIRMRSQLKNVTSGKLVKVEILTTEQLFGFSLVADVPQEFCQEGKIKMATMQVFDLKRNWKMMNVKVPIIRREDRSKLQIGDYYRIAFQESKDVADLIYLY